PKPAARLTAGAPHDLMEKLEGAFGRARIAVAEAEVRIDDADEVELGEVMTLGDELRADDDVDLAGFDVRQLLAQALDRSDEIAGEHQDAALGKKRGDFLIQPFDPRATGDEGFGRLALGAGDRRRCFEAALVAHEAPLEAMLDQPAIAGRALQPKPARTA